MGPCQLGGQGNARVQPLAAVHGSRKAGRCQQALEFRLGSAEQPHPLQQAFLEEQAGQCGYCLSGILISAAALLDHNPDPDEAQIRTALQGNLCRCGAHNRMLRAVRLAAQRMREGGPHAEPQGGAA